jgi:cell division protein ZapA (FtsZ GTPase activity inhibitor)
LLYLVIVCTIVIIYCMSKRKNNLEQMEKRVQMNLDTTKDMELIDRKKDGELSERKKEKATPKAKEI